VVALVIVVALLCEQVGARRVVERRAARLSHRLTAANNRVRKLLKLDDPADTKQLPRIPHAPTYTPGAARPPSTALVRAGERSLERVR
jgi:hypothetical protein